MADAVPRFVDCRIREAIVRAEIDDARPFAFERLARRHGVTVRQRDEHEVAVLADALDLLHAFERLVQNAAKMRIDARDLLPRMTLRCDMNDVRLRVLVKKPQKLRPGVACSPDDAHSHPTDLPFCRS